MTQQWPTAQLEANAGLPVLAAMTPGTAARADAHARWRQGLRALTRKLGGFERFVDELRIEVVKEGGHFLHEQHPALVADTAARFFSHAVARDSGDRIAVRAPAAVTAAGGASSR